MTMAEQASCGPNVLKMIATYCKERKQGATIEEALDTAEAELKELDDMLRGILEELEWSDEEGS